MPSYACTCLYIVAALEPAPCFALDKVLFNCSFDFVSTIVFGVYRSDERNGARVLHKLPVAGRNLHVT